MYATMQRCLFMLQTVAHVRMTDMCCHACLCSDSYHASEYIVIANIHFAAVAMVNMLHTSPAWSSLLRHLQMHVILVGVACGPYIQVRQRLSLFVRGDRAALN